MLLRVRPKLELLRVKVIRVTRLDPLSSALNRRVQGVEFPDGLLTIALCGNCARMGAVKAQYRPKGSLGGA